MNRHYLVAALVVATIHVALASCPSPASAQSDLEIHGSRDPAVIKTQLRTAREFGGATLKRFREEPPNGTEFFAPETVRGARLTYAYIRAARQGIEAAQSVQKYPDPVLALVHKKVTDAWNLSRISSSKITWGYGRAEFLAEAAPALTRAMQLVDQALVLMP
jgi:hypothetical protein